MKVIAEEYTQSITEKFAGLPAIEDPAMRKTVKTVMENTANYLNEDAVSTGDMAQYTPVIMSLIRRTLPTLVGPQMVGMQAMNLPTGRIFVQRVYAKRYDDAEKTEIWANGEIGTETKAGLGDFNFSGVYDTVDSQIVQGYETLDGEKLGWKDYSDAPTGKIGTGVPYNEVSFGIESVDVSVKTRALKGKLTTEVISDLRSVHGIDAEQEISNILQTEITAEIDREIVGRMIREAKIGAQNCNEAGTFRFSTDADGRWSMEKVMGLLIQIEREATWIAQETRRGRGNFILTSPEVAAYLSMANLITQEYGNVGFTPVVNPVGVSYYGMLANRFKVYVDPYMTYSVEANGEAQEIKHTVLVGYKGANVYDSGLFYCPYIPVQWMRSTGSEDFGPRFGIKSRYGLISNPYAIKNVGATAALPATNSFFRKFALVLD